MVRQIFVSSMVARVQFLGRFYSYGSGTNHRQMHVLESANLYADKRQGQNIWENTVLTRNLCTAKTQTFRKFDSSRYLFVQSLDGASLDQESMPSMRADVFKRRPHRPMANTYNTVPHRTDDVRGRKQ